MNWSRYKAVGGQVLIHRLIPVYGDTVKFHPTIIFKQAYPASKHHLKGAAYKKSFLRAVVRLIDSTHEILDYK
jgi:signal peptidase I